MFIKKLFIVGLIALSGSICFGQGITNLVTPGGGLRPHRPHRIHAVHIEKHLVDVSIQSSVATTKVTQVFRNPNNLILEGSYLFPIPDEASITEFTMIMNGKEVRGEVLEKDKARRIYEGIVRSMRDPALLEYVGRDLFRASVFPIPARGVVQVSLTYVQELKREGGIVEYRYPLKTQTFSKKNVAKIAVSITVEDAAPIKSLFSSSHDIDKVRKSETKMVASFEGSDVAAANDFHLFYATSSSDVGLHVLSEKSATESGYYMMKLTPKIDYADNEIAPRDIVFVVDTSGSMQDDEKIEHAKSALVYGLRTLRPQDRFGIVTFATEAKHWGKNLVEANKVAVAEAILWVKKIRATGGTNIDEALTSSLGMLQINERLPMVVFMTDGMPTVGETNEKQILARAAKANKVDARMFVFGVGFDVNARLLDILAEKGKGARDYVTKSGNLELALSGFFDKVAYPVLTDVSVEVNGVDVEQVYPKRISDLFKGTEMTLLGRYTKAGNAVIKLKGKLGNKVREYVFEQRFNDQKSGKDFIAVLWAKRKVGFLWDEIRLKGANKELRDEIVRLGKKFAIATPYTSILVQEDSPVVRRRNRWGSSGSGTSGNNPGPAGGGSNDSTGSVGGARPGAVRLGRKTSAPVKDENAEEAPMEADFGLASTPRTKSVIQSLKAKKMRESLSKAESKNVGTLGRIRLESKSFTRLKTLWVEDGLTDLQRDQSKALVVEAWSEAYFELIRKHPSLGKILAKLDQSHAESRWQDRNDQEGARVQTCG